MIGYVEGRQVATLADAVIVLTAGGVGYEVRVPAPQLAPPADPEAPVRLYVSTVVRDNEIALYGFREPAGKALFEQLLKVSGVGPKVALAFLSAFSPRELMDAVAAEDVTGLASIPGVGRKTATRLCLELKDRLAPWAGAAPGAAPAQAELVSALTNLGFPEKDVQAAIRRLPPDTGSFSDQVKQALHLLAKR